MPPLYLFPAAACLTLAAAYFVWARVWRRPSISEQGIAALLMLAVAMSVYALFEFEPVSERGLNFTMGSAVAVCTVLVQGMYLLGLWRHGVSGLGLFLLPATALPLFAIPFLPDQPAVWIHTRSPMETGHLLISLLAYAILTVAALHAAMHLLLDRALKRKQLGRIAQALPSLVEIETHMYAQVRWATWLLALGILSGLVWQWESLSRFVFGSHKVLLALFSWSVLAALLIMRRRATWQGRRASIMVLAAYGLLVLAYFGVKLVQSWLS